ncbi:hypothetical protein, partial [Bartonella quintana]
MVNRNFFTQKEIASIGNKDKSITYSYNHIGRKICLFIFLLGNFMRELHSRLSFFKAGSLSIALVILLS